MPMTKSIFNLQTNSGLMAWLPERCPDDNDHGRSVAVTSGTLIDAAIVRPYQPDDRESVCNICCDNGYLGQPIDTAFADRDFFSAVFIEPYLDYCADWAFVAEHNGMIVGYLVAAYRAAMRCYKPSMPDLHAPVTWQSAPSFLK